MGKMHAFLDEVEFWKGKLETGLWKCRNWKPVAKRLFLIVPCSQTLLLLTVESVPCSVGSSGEIRGQPRHHQEQYPDGEVGPLGSKGTHGTWAVPGESDKTQTMISHFVYRLHVHVYNDFWGSCFLRFLYEKGSWCTDIYYVYQHFWLDFFYSTWFYEV